MVGADASQAQREELKVFSLRLLGSRIGANAGGDEFQVCMPTCHPSSSVSLLSHRPGSSSWTTHSTGGPLLPSPWLSTFEHKVAFPGCCSHDLGEEEVASPLTIS